MPIVQKLCSWFLRLMEKFTRQIELWWFFLKVYIQLLLFWYYFDFIQGCSGKVGSEQHGPLIRWNSFGGDSQRMILDSLIFKKVILTDSNNKLCDIYVPINMLKKGFKSDIIIGCDTGGDAKLHIIIQFIWSHCWKF